jgi:SAM-dependent methyltransferase
MKFDEKYTKYWESTVNKSVDGTLIAGPTEADHFVSQLDIDRKTQVLDLGCSYGRMYSVLAKYSDHVFGVDPDLYAVRRAQKLPYIQVLEGTSEKTGFENESFDYVFCWAVFELVDHVKGLSEISRLLRPNGHLMLTGKNSNYFLDDELALSAEINAFKKGFSQRFTDVPVMIKRLGEFGLRLKKLVVFPKRGDFGLLNYKDETNSVSKKLWGYEYLLVCNKISDAIAIDVLGDQCEDRFSKTSQEISTKCGFACIDDLFAS